MLPSPQSYTRWISCTSAVFACCPILRTACLLLYFCSFWVHISHIRLHTYIRNVSTYQLDPWLVQRGLIHVKLDDLYAAVDDVTEAFKLQRHNETYKQHMGELAQKLAHHVAVKCVLRCQCEAQ